MEVLIGLCGYFAPKEAKERREDENVFCLHVLSKCAKWLLVISYWLLVLQLLNNEFVAKFHNTNYSNFSFGKFRCSAPELFVDFTPKQPLKVQRTDPNRRHQPIFRLAYDAISEIAAVPVRCTSYTFFLVFAINGPGAMHLIFPIKRPHFIHQTLVLLSSAPILATCVAQLSGLFTASEGG
jgi:hypothetical protein